MVNCYHFILPERYNAFYLHFDVVGSFEEDKVRGPFDNKGEDICCTLMIILIHGLSITLKINNNNIIF